MSYNQQHGPFATLGNHLRFLREQNMETVADVSGAVEIDEDSLQRIEAGHERPAEDILLLLISHFDMQDQEAVQLWELAGYDGSVPGQMRAEDIIADAANGKSVVVLFGVDGRTMYTDSVNIVPGNAGITMTFGQQGGGRQQLPIAKLGMSYDQAANVLAALQRTLLDAKYQSGPKVLPPQTDSSTEK